MSQGFARASGNSGTVTSVATAGLATGGPITGTGTVTVTAASASDQETGTSTTVAVVPNVQQRHASASKCWGQIDVSGGVPSLNVNYNITSVSDDGVGTYGVTIATDFSSGNYVVLITGNRQGGITAWDWSGKSTGSFTVRVSNPSTDAAKDAPVDFSCFGDQ